MSAFGGRPASKAPGPRTVHAVAGRYEFWTVKAVPCCLRGNAGVLLTEDKSVRSHIVGARSADRNADPDVLELYRRGIATDELAWITHLTPLEIGRVLQDEILTKNRLRAAGNGGEL